MSGRLLQRYVDGELGERERAEVDGHVRSCERCRAEIGEQKVVRGHFAAVDEEIVAPFGLTEEVLRRVREAQMSRETVVLPMIRRLTLAAAVACVVLGAIALWQWRSPSLLRTPVEAAPVTFMPGGMEEAVPLIFWSEDPEDVPRAERRSGSDEEAPGDGEREGSRDR